MITLEVDHLIPLSKGGDNAMVNLVSSCMDCNRGKSNVLLTALPEVQVANLEQQREQLAQLKAMAKLARDHRALIEDMFQEISAFWIDKEGEDPAKLQVSGQLASAIRRFLKVLPASAVMEASEITWDRLPHAERWNQTKYFCGVCYRTIDKKNGIPMPWEKKGQTDA